MIICNIPLKNISDDSQIHFYSVMKAISALLLQLIVHLVVFPIAGYKGLLKASNGIKHSAGSRIVKAC